MEKQTHFLHRVRLTLTNALNTPELLAALTVYSYNASKIQEGISLYDTITDLTRQRERAQEAQYQATQLLNAAKEELLYMFKIHVNTARLAYRREAEYQDTLRITRTLPRETAACLEHIQRFYAHVPAPMMTKYRVSSKELTETARLVERVQELLALREKAMSQPQQITEARQRAFAELQTWMRHFDTIARVALAEQPQHLEALGQVMK